MAYLSECEVQKLGLKRVGKNIKISEKASIYNANQIEIDDNSRIDDFCVISGKIKIGRNVHIAPFCLVAGGEKGIVFGDYSGLAYHVQVFTQSDDYSGHSMTNPTIPEQFKIETKKNIEIGKHVIVGAGSLIMPGAHLAEGVSVGAMSLIRKPTEPWSIYVGNPAKKIKERKKEILDKEIEYMEWSKKND